jgi:hypothetical protein
MVKNKKKIIFIVTTIALAVGGFAITQWWVRNVYSYKSYKDTDMTVLVEDESAEINSNDIP